MDYELFALIREEGEKQLCRFSTDHALFIVAFDQKPVIALGLQKGRAMDKVFAELAAKLQTCGATIAAADYFKSRLPLTDPDSGPIFWYLVLTLTVDGRAKRTMLEDELMQELKCLFAPFGLRFEIASQTVDPAIIDCHIARHGMNGWASAFTEHQTRQSRRTKTEREARHIQGLPEGLPDMKGQIPVAQFFQKLTHGSNLIANALYIGDFILESERHYKYWRTEWLGIEAFLNEMNWPGEDIIELGFGSDPWDAYIRSQDGRDVVIEVTQALPAEAHQIRHAIVAYGSLPADIQLRTLHQKGVDAFPDPVVETINEKHRKTYPDGTILIATVLGEYTGEDSAVISAWIEDIRLRTHIGAFSAIYLVEIARSRVFKIF
jgi:hypothetical protein